jgi:hypothetical protein
MPATKDCPACLMQRVPTWHGEPAKDEYHYDCQMCGHYVIDGLLEVALPDMVRRSRKLGPALSHTIRRNCKPGQQPFVNRDLVERIERDPSLPNPAVQIDNLILHMGYSVEPGEPMELTTVPFQAIIGAWCPRSNSARLT